MDGTTGRSGDLSRLIVLRDDSRGAFGVPEDKELGSGNAFIFGFVESVDADGTETEIVQGFPQPRNWHLIEGPVFEGTNTKQRRIDVALIADHQSDFPGWALDTRDKSPFLDDWFESGNDIQHSTRIGDRRDPKGRTSLLSQLVIVKDDHLLQYTTALVLGPEVGNHEKAAAGYVYDNNNDFMGKLSTFWTTNKEDMEGQGREKTPYGYLGMRHDAHVEMPGTDHGRFHIVRLPCDDYEEMPKRFAGGATSGASDSGGDGAQPQVHFFKSRMMWDHTKKGEDTGLPLESAQLRPVYHCVDGSEKKKTINNVEIFDFEEITNITNITNNFNNTTIIVVIVQGGPGGSPGGRTIIETFDGNNPGPPQIEVVPGPAGGPEKPRDPPPGGPAGGRIVCLPLSHNPPLIDGLEHLDHGYVAVSEDGKGGQRGWIGGWVDELIHLGTGAATGTGGSPGSSVVDEIIAQGVGVATGRKSAGWSQLVNVPQGTPEGRVPITDGEGGFNWDELKDETPAPVPGPSTAILFDVLGYTPTQADQHVEDGYVWQPDEDDPRRFCLEQRIGGDDAGPAFFVDGTGIKHLEGWGQWVITKPDGTPDGYVPVSDSEFGAIWQAMGGGGGGFWGTGVDGAGDLDGANTYGWCAKISSTFYELLQDVNLTDLTVRTGVTLSTAGFRCYVNGICTIEAGAVYGRDGVDAGPYHAAGSNLVGSTLEGSAAGGAGATAPGAGSNGSSETNSLGGAGGGGGSATWGIFVPPAPSTGGSATRPAAGKGTVQNVPGVLTGEARGASGSCFVTGGGGGGGGTQQDGGFANGDTGGGGGGGAPTQLATARLVNLGRISSNGGKGANALSIVGAFGGGGGGGGGVVLLAYGLSGSTLGTVTATGGTGGTGAASAGGSAQPGHAGSDGVVVILAVGSGGGGGSASSLMTTGADVDVSGAAPPSAGQVLKATDATHATWQPALSIARLALSRSTNVGIADDGSFHDLTWDSNDSIPSEFSHSTTVNAHEITVNADGLLFVQATPVWEYNGSGQRETVVFTADITGWTHAANNGGGAGTYAGGVAMVQVTAGDKFSIKVKQTAFGGVGTNLNVLGGANTSVLQAFLIKT